MGSTLSVARAAQDRPLDAIFGPSAGFYALDKPLPPEQQEEREALQAAAHCDALPDDMLPVMVGIQRLRDARLAETALEALAMHGAPVVVITGNGHVSTRNSSFCSLLRLLSCIRP